MNVDGLPTGAVLPLLSRKQGLNATRLCCMQESIHTFKFLKAHLLQVCSGDVHKG